MVTNKRKRLNLTPVVFRILAGIGTLFLLYMLLLADKALSKSWDSALLFIAVFFAVAGLVLLFRWLQYRYETPSSRPAPRYLEEAPDDRHYPLPAERAELKMAGAAPPAAPAQAGQAQNRGLKAWPGAVVTVIILIVPVAAYFLGATPFAGLAVEPAQPFDWHDLILPAAALALCLIYGLIASRIDADNNPWLFYLFRLFFRL